MKIKDTQNRMKGKRNNRVETNPEREAKDERKTKSLELGLVHFFSLSSGKMRTFPQAEE